MFRLISSGSDFAGATHASVFSWLYTASIGCSITHRYRATTQGEYFQSNKNAKEQVNKKLRSSYFGEK